MADRIPFARSVTSLSRTVRGSMTRLSSEIRAIMVGCLRPQASLERLGALGQRSNRYHPCRDLCGGKCPAAHSREVIGGRDVELRMGRGRQQLHDPFGPFLRLVIGHRNHRQDRDLFSRIKRVPINHQGRFDGGKRQLIDPHGPRQWVLFNAVRSGPPPLR